MNLEYTEISNEEADRIIKSDNLVTLAGLINDIGRGRVGEECISDQEKSKMFEEAYYFSKSILSN